MGSHLTTRDVQCANFINRTNLHMTSSQIAKLFYQAGNEKSSKTIANRRLAVLIKQHQLKRVRQYVSQEFIYYSKFLPTRLEHKKMMVDFLCQLKGTGISFDLDSVETEIRTWQKDYQIRPDMLLNIEDSRGVKYHLIVECDFSKNFTSDKYAKFLSHRNNDEEIFKVLTNRLMIVSVCKVPPNPIKLMDGRLYSPVWVNSSFENITNIKNRITHKHTGAMPDQKLFVKRI